MHLARAVAAIMARWFCGPPGVANGGVASGSLAGLLDGAAEVTLRRPVPLDRSLPVHRDGGGTLVVEDGGRRLAKARPATLAGDGRKLRAGSALLGPDGEVLAAARTVWITAARRAVALSAGAGP
jgi:hypothetical protein